ncbi:dioxygenase [Nocardia sp. NPDC051570]|uniref:dioxygenase family protein n=1 Tax=Nocardia sp. NPDC051570 TaxID=3364324 RepID=UPI0037B6AD58
MMTMLSRRKAMFFLGAAGVASVAAACSTDAASGTSGTSAQATTTAGSAVAAMPQETEGPYPGDGSNGPNVLLESGIVRRDVTTSFGSYSGVAQGVPMTLRLTMRDLTKGSAPGTGMAVYIWHCDRDGEYSLYGEGITDQNYLRGVQVADSAGELSFTSIFPACYSGRWPHIHFEVYDSLETAVAGQNARLTSQIALPKDVCDAVYAYDSGYSQSIAKFAQLTLAADDVFGDGWDAEMATVSGSPVSGLTVTLTIGVAKKSQNTQSGNRSGMPPVPGGMPTPGGTPAPGGTPTPGGKPGGTPAPGGMPAPGGRAVPGGKPAPGGPPPGNR